MFTSTALLLSLLHLSYRWLLGKSNGCPIFEYPYGKSTLINGDNIDLTRDNYNEKKMYGKGKAKESKEEYTVVAGLRKISPFGLASLQYSYLILKHFVDFLRMTCLL